MVDPPRLLGILALALVVAPVLAADAPFVVRSGHFEVKGSGARVESIRVDPRGRGRYGANLTTGFGPDEWLATPETRAVVEGTRATVTGLERRLSWEIAVPQGHQPEAVPPGGSLGQSFTVARSYFRRGVVTVGELPR